MKVICFITDKLCYPGCSFNCGETRNRHKKSIKKFSLHFFYFVENYFQSFNCVELEIEIEIDRKKSIDNFFFDFIFELCRKLFSIF